MSVEAAKVTIEIETQDDTEPGLGNVEKKVDKVGKTSKQAKSQVDKFGESISKLGESSERASQKVTGFDRSAEKTQRDLMKWVKEKYEIILEAKDKASPILSMINGGVRSFAGKTWGVTLKAVDLVTAPVRGVINLLKNPILQAGAVLGVSIGLKDTIDTYKDFEATMSRVKALSGATGTEMEQLNKKAKEMGAVTKYSGTESAEAFTYMSQAGWDVQEMLDGISGVMNLAASDGLDLATTTDIVANALTAFGLKAKDSAGFADVLAIASSESNTNVAELGEAFKYVAPVAGAMKYSIQDVSLALGVMSNNAVKGGMAGTSLKTSLANLAAPTDEMASTMKKYGISLTDTQGRIKPLRGLLDNLRGSLRGLSESEQTAAASTLFGKEAMAGMLGIINTAESDYKELANQIENANGAAERMSGTMQDNLAGELEELGGVVETVQLSWGERLKPYVKELASTIKDNMPALEDFGIKVFNSLDKKIAETKEKIAEFTSTTEWENADFFGKVGIAWNDLIAEPFSNWWNSTGHDFFVGGAASIGQSIGKGIMLGFMTILGIDVSGIMGEGESIGNAFAKGFMSGTKDVFQDDETKKALKESSATTGSSAVGTYTNIRSVDNSNGGEENFVRNRLGVITKGVFSSAGKVLPGGQEADLSSLISAALLVKAGTTAISLGGKGIGLGKKIAGSGIPQLAMKGIGSYSLAAEAAGTGMANGSGLVGMAGKSGVAMGGAATTSAGMVALGAAGITGGVVGGAAAISGGMDLYKGFKSENEAEAAAYKKSGAWKLGGVGAGAAAGAAIGSVVPVVGTAAGALIGAGIGGVTGIVQGNREKKEYEESLKAAEALALAQEQAKYESQELKDALADTQMTAEKFGLMFQAAVGENLQSHFGNLKLSMAEIQSMAKDITFAESIEGITKFSEASTASKDSMATLEAGTANMEKLNWKAGLGLKFDETDIQDYKTGIDTMLSSVKDYVENRHYEAQAAIDLLLLPESGIDMTSGLNTVYTRLQEQLNTLGSNLTASVNVALEDGVISLDEQTEISNLQKQIAEITQKVTDAETEADFKALKIKYSGADLDIESFAQLQAELQAQVGVATQNYDEALKVGISSLELQLSEGAITQEQYSEQLQALADGYQANIKDMQIRVESFQLNTIAESYAEELDGILPGIEGTTADKLGIALHNAMSRGVDPMTWTSEMAATYLGLESLSKETIDAVGGLMAQLSSTLPSSLDFSGTGATATHELESSINNSMSAMELSGVQTGVSGGVSNAIANTDMAQIMGEIDNLKSRTGTSIDSAFAPGFDTRTQARVTLDWIITNPTVNIPFTGGGTGSATVTAGIAKPDNNANGSIVTGPILSWVGEDGPEAIIPLGGKRRSRGLSLWEQAGEMLGVGKYANGGFVGGSNISSISSLEAGNLNYIDEAIKNAPVGNNEQSDDNYDYSSSVPEGDRGTVNSPIKVEVNVSPTFEISGGNGSNGADILSMIQSHIRQLADEIGGEIAEQLEKIYSNMPQKA